MNTGILLVHGYTGSRDNLSVLQDKLSKIYGSEHIVNLSLPAHGNGQAPGFDLRSFEQAVTSSARALKKSRARLVIFGHSTGGSLVLSAITGSDIQPDLLILAGVPRQVDTDCMNRWQAHWASHGVSKDPPSFSDVCRMISLINSQGKTDYQNQFPVLILHGQKDDLVLSSAASEWQNQFKGAIRTILLPGAGHHFPSDPPVADHICDILVRAVRDIEASGQETMGQTLDRVIQSEPEIHPFLRRSPYAANHLSQCPSARRLAGVPEILPEILNTDPVFANIEITTHCNLACRFCMRTRLGINGRDMSFDLFCRILERLPHVYKITLVGLGEPLLHPGLVDFIRLVKRYGKKAALVTNALELGLNLSRELIRAGLDSIVFSIDAPDQKLASKLRAGTDLDQAISNIKQFTGLERASGRQMSKAVFSALSMLSIDSLIPLVDLVEGLGVDVLMLSDLNFYHNLNLSLLKNIDWSGKKKIRAALKHSFSRQLPVLSVHGLEEFGLRQRYHRFLALPPSKLYTRPRERTHCVSPWQTLPVNVNGEVYLCDCQPEKIAGNLITDAFDPIWNGILFQDHRHQMTRGRMPAICSICPRL